MILLLLSGAIFPGAAFAESLSGRVASIIDGDSLIIVDGARQRHRIRLAAIDAPEPTQNFGEPAKTNLSAMTIGRLASADCQPPDRARVVRCVVRVDKRDIGLEQIRRGMAWWDADRASQLSDRERADYAQAEFLAKLHRYGLWNSRNPRRPSEWRRGRDDD